ncbi:nucleotidyltransferase substrate binding protein [Sphingomonas sp.]|jgi:nucleotidyltransferase substrate binding protein (TIGR01987 family)|uniref:nucleotidyltransferase substrate binding protein n=1 Tax=Sphingomonas sp. TaxID=28214 RepID=UPI002ED8A9CF
MDATPTPRWEFRLRSFTSEVSWLTEAVELRAARGLSDLEKAGMIKRFEIAWEQGWKLLADVLFAELTPPNPVTSASSIRGAFAAGIIDDGDAWMAASKLRHSLTHTYDQAIRDAGLEAIAERFLPLFIQLRDSTAARLHA